MNLQQLALDHLLGEADEQVEHAQVALFERHFESLHVEPVAGQNALLVAPGGVGGRPAAARVGAVNNVVVDQRGRVHHLDHRAKANSAVAKKIQLMRSQQQKRGPDALAAAFAQVLGNFGDGADAGSGVAAELLFHRNEVLPQQLKDLPRRSYRECAQSAPILIDRQGKWRLIMKIH